MDDLNGMAPLGSMVLAAPLQLLAVSGVMQQDGLWELEVQLGGWWQHLVAQTSGHDKYHWRVYTDAQNVWQGDMNPLSVPSNE